MGAVDFQTGVMRPYDNWVRNEMDTTKTSDSEAIPMTPRLTRALAQIRRRGYTTGEQDFVFVSELTRDSPVSERPLREAFKSAVKAAGLKPIRMYNLRHSFGTTLARNGIDIRTVQALMRHDRLSTTEQYMAYSPRPDLAEQIARALDPHSFAGACPAHPVAARGSRCDVPQAPGGGDPGQVATGRTAAVRRDRRTAFRVDLMALA
jgi:integrase